MGVSDPVETRPIGVTTVNLVGLGQTVWAPVGGHPFFFLGGGGGAGPHSFRMRRVRPLETAPSPQVLPKQIWSL